VAYWLNGCRSRRGGATVRLGRYGLAVNGVGPEDCDLLTTSPGGGARRLAAQEREVRSKAETERRAAHTTLTSLT
jgi:hypothetical protein